MSPSHTVSDKGGRETVDEIEEFTAGEALSGVCQDHIARVATEPFLDVVHVVREAFGVGHEAVPLW